jgi:hypothetical protein
VFSEPKRFEPEGFEYIDEWCCADTSFDADLRSEKVSFGVWTYAQTLENLEAENAKSLLLALLPYYGGKVPKKAPSSIKSDASFLENFWGEDGEISERYSFLGDGSFEVPFSKLGTLEKHLVVE